MWWIREFILIRHCRLKTVIYRRYGLEKCTHLVIPTQTQATYRLFYRNDGVIQSTRHMLKVGTPGVPAALSRAAGTRFPTKERPGPATFSYADSYWRFVKQLIERNEQLPLAGLLLSSWRRIFDCVHLLLTTFGFGSFTPWRK